MKFVRFDHTGQEAAHHPVRRADIEIEGKGPLALVALKECAISHEACAAS